MTKNRCSTLVISLAIGALLICAATAQAAAAAGPVPSHSAIRAVQPAVSGLFQVKAPRVWSNGVPDFLNSWDAFQSRTSSAILNKAYAFTTIDGLSHQVLYAGVERASSKSPVVFEFSRLEGGRSVGDLRIEVEIDNDGGIGTVQFQSYGDGGKAGLKLLPIAILAGSGCNDAGTACVVANGATLEVGANLSQLLGASKRPFAGVQITAGGDATAGTFAIVTNPDTCTPATDPACPFYDVCVKEAPTNDLNNPSCTANDVQLTELVEGSVEVLADLDGGIGCDGESDADDPQCPWGGDCVTFTATGHYVLTSQTRYDIGTFLALFPNSDTQSGAKSGECLRFAYTNGDTVDLDSDSCGDLDQATAGLAVGGTNISFGPVTVPCVDDGEGNIVINHCETWSQRNNEIICNGSDDVQAGTGSKCNCGVLSGICIAVNSGDTCNPNVCQGTCQNATGGSSTTPPTTCASNADCTVLGETCKDIVLTSQPVVCADQTDNDCDNPDTCVNGACQPNYEPTTTKCRESSCDITLASCCDVPEFCDGAGSCPSDGFATDAHECRAQEGVCDVAEHCDGTKATCPDDGVVSAASETECRRAFNECDVHETCDGISKDCPEDFCGPAVARPAPFCSTS